jgi:ubiquinone/menaquinone biosynthesis C-methylase UbiE
VAEKEQSESVSPAVAVFDRVAASYDSVGVPWFTPIAERLVRELAPAPGERAVDIGCGRGAALFALAHAVGPGGSVLGFDLAPSMVELTRADAQTRQFTWVTVEERDAAAPDLPFDEFDLATASLVIFFLADPLAALKQWRDSLKPGGRLGITTFGAPDPRWEQVDAVFRPYLPREWATRWSPSSSTYFGTDDAVTTLVGAAGLENVRTVGEDVSVTFNDAEQWRLFSMSHGQRAMWDAVPESERDVVLTRVNQRLADLAASDGSITFTRWVRYTIGHRPTR